MGCWREQGSGSEMAQEVNKLATEPEDLNSIPGTQMVGSENQLKQSVL